jgi:hypothetical protein
MEEQFELVKQIYSAIALDAWMMTRREYSDKCTLHNAHVSESASLPPYIQGWYPNPLSEATSLDLKHTDLVKSSCCTRNFPMRSSGKIVYAASKQ